MHAVEQLRVPFWTLSSWPCRVAFPRTRRLPAQFRSTRNGANRSATSCCAARLPSSSTLTPAAMGTVSDESPPSPSAKNSSVNRARGASTGRNSSSKAMSTAPISPLNARRSESEKAAETRIRSGSGRRAQAHEESVVTREAQRARGVGDVVGLSVAVFGLRSRCGCTSTRCGRSLSAKSSSPRSRSRRKTYAGVVVCGREAAAEPTKAAPAGVVCEDGVCRLRRGIDDGGVGDDDDQRLRHNHSACPCPSSRFSSSTRARVARGAGRAGAVPALNVKPVAAPPGDSTATDGDDDPTTIPRSTNAPQALDFTTLPLTQLRRQLRTSFDVGLTVDEVARRISKRGANRLTRIPANHQLPSTVWTQTSRVSLLLLALLGACVAVSAATTTGPSSALRHGTVGAALLVMVALHVGLGMTSLSNVRDEALELCRHLDTLASRREIWVARRSEREEEGRRADETEVGRVRRPSPADDDDDGQHRSPEKLNEQNDNDLFIPPVNDNNDLFKWVRTRGRQLVPGDLVRLCPRDLVPADMRVVRSWPTRGLAFSVWCEQASSAAEEERGRARSQAATATREVEEAPCAVEGAGAVENGDYRSDMVEGGFLPSGVCVASGLAEAVVIRTGVSSHLGQIVEGILCSAGIDPDLCEAEAVDSSSPENE